MRKRIPYENPQGRRVNVLAAYSPLGPQPALTWGLERGSLVAGQFVGFLRQIPRLPGTPLIVVLDNGSLHRNWVVTEALPALRKEGIYLWYLPPYSPELNDIEAIFGVVKRQELPERRYTSYAALEEAIITGFTHVEHRLLQKHETQPGLAA